MIAVLLLTATAAANRAPVLSAVAQSKVAVPKLESVLALRGGADLGPLNADVMTIVQLASGFLYAVEIGVPAFGASKKYFTNAVDHPWRSWFALLIAISNGSYAMAKFQWGVEPVEVLKYMLFHNVAAFALYAYQHYSTKEIKNPQALYILGTLAALSAYICFA